MNAALHPLPLDQRPAIDRPISMIGMMGCGKSTVGKRLATMLDLAFIDADHAIEEAAGLSVREIFAQYGEESFRDGERRVIARLVDGGPCVIATGGGAFMNEQTRALLLEKTVVVWLDADIDTLVERVSRRAGRPLLEGKDPRTVLQDLLAVRNPVYAEAHLRVQSRQLPHDAAVKSVVEALQAYSRRQPA